MASRLHIRGKSTGLYYCELSWLQLLITATQIAPVTSINDTALDLNQKKKKERKKWQAEVIRLGRQAKKSLALLIIVRKETSFHVRLPCEQADLFGLHVRELKGWKRDLNFFFVIQSN